jgi:hypothetical protein
MKQSRTRALRPGRVTLALLASAAAGAGTVLVATPSSAAPATTTSTRVADDEARPGSLLSDADFRRWYLSRSVTVAGTAASAVVLPLPVYSTSGSAALTAAVVGLEAVPYLWSALARSRPATT